MNWRNTLAARKDLMERRFAWNDTIGFVHAFMAEQAQDYHAEALGQWHAGLSPEQGAIHRLALLERTVMLVATSTEQPWEAIPDQFGGWSWQQTDLGRKTLPVLVTAWSEYDLEREFEQTTICRRGRA